MQLRPGAIDSVMSLKQGQSARLPAPLIAVAVLFIAFGVIGLLDAIATLGQGLMLFSVLAVGLIIGTGLLRDRSIWRAIGLIFSAVGAVAGLLVGFAVATPSEPHPVPIRLFGRTLMHASPTQAGAVWIMLGLLNAVAFDVLRRSATRAHFQATKQ